MKMRNYHCYARGEANKQGNLNCKILGDQLRVNFGKRDYQYYPLHVSTKVTSKMRKQGRLSDREKLRLLLLLAQQKKFSYNIRLRKKDAHHYKVNIEYDLPDPEVKVTFANGAIGVDTNTDHLAIAETDARGNLINVESFDSQRIQFARKNKRDYDSAIIVNQVIEYAKKTGKGIVFENLKFKKKKKGSKKQNRKRSNFCFRKFLDLLEAKCIQYGIAYRPVKAAYTSIIGNLKYAEMHKITGHQAAAYVIARRGLGYKEKISLYRQNKVSVKAYLIRTLETSKKKSGKYKGKRFSNWKLWSRLKKEQAVLTGPQSRLQMPFRELCGSRSSTTLEWEKSQANPSLEQVGKVANRNVSYEGRKTLFQNR
jgi:IS605 OrfB family transposase